MATTFYNQTLTLTYTEDSKWALALDKDRVLFGQGFNKLLTYIQNNLTCKGKVVIWNFHLSEMIVWTGEERFTKVQRNGLKSFNVKYAEIGENIEFKNAYEYFLQISLGKIAEQKYINSANELTIIWNAFEKERINNNGYISRIPTTYIGYVRKGLQNKADFPRLAKSITPETHKLISECKSGGLCGIDESKIDETHLVNCYDFKSFYPWIMVSQLFPQGSYGTHTDWSNPKVLEKHPFVKDRFWIARLRFKFIKPKKADWLGLKKNNEIVITNLDYKIIKEDYYFELERVIEIIPFLTSAQLPDEIRDYIMEQFKKKESCAKNTEEYTQAKVFLNSIYGLFNQDQTKYDNPIDCWSAKQRPLVIGKFVAAYGRYFLWKIMRNSDPIHWDTDGFKTEYNLSREIFLFNQMRKIKDSMLGQLMLEEKWAEVTVFGNKQYLLNDKLKLAGTKGDLAKEYCDKIGEVPHCGLIIPPEYTSRILLINNKITKIPFTIGGKTK